MKCLFLVAEKVLLYIYIYIYISFFGDNSKTPIEFRITICNNECQTTCSHSFDSNSSNGKFKSFVLKYLKIS